MERVFSDAPLGSKTSEELSHPRFAQFMAGYSALMSVTFGCSAWLGHVWLYPTWVGPLACLALSFICMYAATQKAEAKGTFASVVGMTVFLGLAIGSGTAYFAWPEEVFISVMLTVTVVFFVSVIGMGVPEALKEWGLACAWGGAFLAVLLPWEFGSRVAQVKNMPFVDISLWSWLGGILYMMLTAVIWIAAIEKSAQATWRTHHNALLISGGLPLFLFRCAARAKESWQRRQQAKARSRSYKREYGGIQPEDD